MKSIAHFVTGVAIATFFPQVVRDASQHLGFGPVLGGVAGVLPDTLDFKFLRFFERRDVEIDPATITAESGARPNSQAVADQIAEAIAEAYETGKCIKVQLHTVRLDSDRWRQYSVTFDPVHGVVLVRMGPVVTTAQVPFSGSEFPELAEGRAQVNIPFVHTEEVEFTVDIFAGPSLAFEREDNAVRVIFLPWHRSWTHSLVFAGVLGLAGWLLRSDYGLIMALAAIAHILEDQLGFLGSSLLFPLTRKRMGGLRLFHSGDALPNFLVVWAGLAAILLNLDRFSATPHIPVVPFVLSVIAFPSLILLGLHTWMGPQPPSWSATEAPSSQPAPPTPVAWSDITSPDPVPTVLAVMAAESELLDETDGVDI